MTPWGIIQSMKLSLEQNNALLKSRKSLKKQLDEKGTSLTTKKKLEFKKVSEEELEIIKAKIRRDAKKSRNMKLLVFGTISIITILLFYFLMS